VAAAEATRKEGAEWSTWFILARIEAERGRIGPALRAYDRAHRADPLFGLLKA
jgi:cytochrome c-type biogenesis protein CcmH/NrfG